VPAATMPSHDDHPLSNPVSDRHPFLKNSPLFLVEFDFFFFPFF
jgi:hypothetical protein